MIEKLLTPCEVAAALQVPKPTLYKWRHQRKGPAAIRIGRHLRYHPDDVAEWLAAKRET